MLSGFKIIPVICQRVSLLHRAVLGLCGNSGEGLRVQKLGKPSPHSLDKLVNALSPEEKLHGEQDVPLPLGILRGQITREGLSE